MLVAALVVLVLFGLALAIAARMLRARHPALPHVANWTSAAGEEYTALSEAERCDLIFAVAALEDDAGRELLVRALDDPSETVALAAARGLSRQGRSAALERYLATCPAERARTLRFLVEILN